MERDDFAARFCEHFNCPRAEFEAQLFRRALYVHARLLAPILRKFNADLFEPDFQMIHHLGQARTPLELHAELAAFQDANRNQRTYLRTALRIRVSGRKVATLAHQVYAGKASVA